MEWYKDVTSDDGRMQKLFKIFESRSKSIKTVNKKNFFKIAEYKEIFEASREIIVDDEGEMMEEDEYIDYVTNRRVDRLDYNKAKVNWGAMVTNRKQEYFDKKGKGNAFRFRIKIKDKVLLLLR